LKNKESPMLAAMDIHEIFAHLPHRYPFLLVDRVIALEPGKSLTAIKNVTINEPFFQGHFPVRPVFPGVLIIEALAQATGLLAFKSGDQAPPSHSLFYLVGIDNARFKQPVEPGDQLILEIVVNKTLRGVWKFSGKAMVDGHLAASADLMCAARDVTG